MLEYFKASHLLVVSTLFAIVKHLQCSCTCFLRILLVQFAALVGVADTQVRQEVNEERTVEVLAQLVQDKPDMVVIIIMLSLQYVFFSIFSKENTLDLSFYNTTKQYEF